MNYKPFAGYYFFGAGTATKRASFACSWGLLEVTPTPGLVKGGFITNICLWLYERFR